MRNVFLPQGPSEKQAEDQSEYIFQQACILNKHVIIYVVVKIVKILRIRC